MGSPIATPTGWTRVAVAGPAPFVTRETFRAPGYVDAVGDSTDAVTFFVGSISFTSAALLQYVEVANSSRALPGLGAHERWRLFTWEPRRIDWWAAVVQLTGTLFFNASTYHAVDQHLSSAQKVVPSTDQIRSVTLMNLGTFLGALGFLVGAVLLLPERTHPEPDREPAPSIASTSAVP